MHPSIARHIEAYGSRMEVLPDDRAWTISFIARIIPRQGSIIEGVGPTPSQALAALGDILMSQSLATS